MEYPYFRYVESRGQIFLQLRLPRNYKELVPEFYESGGRERIDEFTKNLEKSTEDPLFGKQEISLGWDEARGLMHIAIGPSGGLELDEIRGSFQEHNLGTRTSLITAAIAINYVKELTDVRK